MLESAFDFKSWTTYFPSPEEVRPKHCPGCQCASRPPGCPLTLVGHGVVLRGLWGPVEPRGEPQTCDVRVRRFLCRLCGAVIRVGPRGLVPRRRYGAGAIALALALWGLLPPGLQKAGESAEAAIRRRVSPWPIVSPESGSRWLSLHRWLDAARGGSLDANKSEGTGQRDPGPTWKPRERALRFVRAVVAQSPERSRGSLDFEQVFRVAHAGGWTV